MRRKDFRQTNHRFTSASTGQTTRVELDIVSSSIHASRGIRASVSADMRDLGSGLYIVIDL